MEALTMETPMTEWNDDRLDELNGRVKEGFAEVDKRFEQIDKRFAEIDKRFEHVATKEEMSEVRAQLTQLNERFDRFLFILVAACFGMIGSVFVAALGFFLQS
jgi:tetrahydromethanopterin S-methyltransferase subunit G